MRRAAPEVPLPSTTCFFASERPRFHPRFFAFSRASFSSRAQGAATRTKIASPHRGEGQVTLFKHLTRVTLRCMVSVRSSTGRAGRTTASRSSCFSLATIPHTVRVIASVRARLLCHYKFRLAVFARRHHTRQLQRRAGAPVTPWATEHVPGQKRHDGRLSRGA